MIGAVPGKAAGVLSPLRDSALPLALFSGVAHVGAAVLVGLMVLGAFPGGAGGVMLVLWSLFSLFVSLVGYRRMEERRSGEAASALAAQAMPKLASKVIELYPRPIEDPAIAEVFELYRRAQEDLEEGDHRGAGEAIERGMALAEGILAGGVASVRDEDGDAEGEGSWN